MSLFSRLSRRRASPPTTSEPSTRQAQKATLVYLSEFVRTRPGVEAYIEPETNDTGTTLMLIASTGEWTRRRVPSSDTAREVATSLSIPVYDVQRTGYPQRMRDWNSSQRAKK